MRSRLPSLVLLLCALGTCSVVNAQIFRVQGGASTTFGAEGASVNIKAPSYESEIGAGLLDGHFQYGFTVRTNLLGNALSLGDDTVKIELPTDVFDSSHYFLARGVGLRHSSLKTKSMWYGFAGTTSLGFSTPFFMASRSQSGLGILYYERQLGNTIHFVSRTLLSRRQTSIQGLEWSPLNGVKLSASGGVGSNQPYFASALKIDRENFVLRGAYIAEGENFQRLQVPSPISTEPEKFNVAAMYRINRRWSVRGSHQNILQPAVGQQPLLRATVDQAFTYVNVAKFDLGGGVVESRTGVRRNVGINIYATRAVNQLLSVNANIYQSRPDQGSVANTFTATVRERVDQRLVLTQTLIRSNGQTTAALGGEFVSNRLSAFVGYQTVYVPFRPDNAFQQALSFNVSVNLPHNTRLNTGSYIDPQGRIRYTIGVGTYLYRLRGMAGPLSTPQSFRFPKFVSEGIVVDINGQPIEGAAIHVDGKVAYSDSEGRFMVRLNKVSPHTVVIAMEEFTAVGVWEVIEAPSTVLAQPEDEAIPIRIVLRRVPTNRKTSTPLSHN